MSAWVTMLAAPLAAQDLEDPGLTFDLGPADAPVTVVAFVDFGCHYCAQFARDVFPVLSREFVEPGHVHWRFLPYDQGAFRHSERALKAAICADDHRQFRPMHDRLFAEREAWTRERRPETMFVAFAADLGLDTAAFRACLGGRETDRRADDLRKVARRSRIRGTPTFLVNDEFIVGLQPIEVFRTVLADAIDAGGRNPPGGFDGQPPLTSSRGPDPMDVWTGSTPAARRTSALGGRRASQASYPWGQSLLSRPSTRRPAPERASGAGRLLGRRPLAADPAR